jgi:DDE superfamily endonuclease
VMRRRHRWRIWQRHMDAGRFLFLDARAPEAIEATATNTTRRYGRCPAGRRLAAAVPHGHWKTATFIAGLRRTGIIAPLVLDGPMTGRAFCAYVEQVLLPALDPGDVVVPDNLAAHKSLPSGTTRGSRASKRPSPLLALTFSTCRPAAPT